MEPVKENFNWKRLLTTIGIVLVTAGAIGGTTYYLMAKNQKSIQASSYNSVEALQKQIDDLNKKAAATTKNSTVATTTPVASSKDLQSKTEIANFCAGGDASILRGYTYVTTENGSFVLCSVGALPGSGHEVIGKIINNNWQQIYTGQQTPPLDTANQYKIPASLIGPADLSGAAVIYPGYKNYQY